jgi:hypothetical protein
MCSGLYVAAALAVMGPMSTWSRLLAAPTTTAAPSSAGDEPPAQAPGVPAALPRGAYTVEEGAHRAFSDGIAQQEYVMVRATGRKRVLVFRPPGRGYPVVLVPPAGGRAISCALLGDSDLPEVVP